MTPSDLRELAGESLRTAAPALEMFLVEQLITVSSGPAPAGDEALCRAGQCKQLALVIQQLRAAANAAGQAAKPLGIKPLHRFEQSASIKKP